MQMNETTPIFSETLALVGIINARHPTLEAFHQPMWGGFYAFSVSSDIIVTH